MEGWGHQAPETRPGGYQGTAWEGMGWPCVGDSGGGQGGLVLELLFESFTRATWVAMSFSKSLDISEARMWKLDSTGTRSKMGVLSQY